MSYIITKSPKSYGIGILLILVLGPIGLFYASVVGAIFMTFILPVALVVMFLTKVIPIEFSILLIPGVIVYYLLVLIWGITAINAYNRKLENNAYTPQHYFHSNTHQEEAHNSTYNYYRELEKRNSSNAIWYFLAVVAILFLLLYFMLIK